MKLAVKHTIRATIASLLLSIFLGALLMKPAHVLLIHHHQQCQCLNLHGNVISGNNEHFCHICDFEFCEFIPQGKTVVPTAYCYIHRKKAPQLTACIIRQSSHLFQLRAPPAL